MTFVMKNDEDCSLLNALSNKSQENHENIKWQIILEVNITLLLRRCHYFPLFLLSQREHHHLLS